MAKTNKMSILTKGFIRENPTFRLVLGTCPTLAITTAAINGIGMGVAATLVLLGSNIAISLLRNVIPARVRIPAYITIIATFVTIIQMLVKAFLPAIDNALGIFLPLIVVNCIILARAEMFASKNSVLPSILDALGMGIGFTAALTLMGLVREFFGAGTLFGVPITEGVIEPMIVFILPPGGFFVFGVLVALSNKVAVKMGKKPVKSMGCGNCNVCQGAENCAQGVTAETAVGSQNGAVRSKVAQITNADIAKEQGETLPSSYDETTVQGSTETDVYVRTEASRVERAQENLKNSDSNGEVAAMQEEPPLKDDGLNSMDVGAEKGPASEENKSLDQDSKNESEEG